MLRSFAETLKTVYPIWTKIKGWMFGDSRQYAELGQTTFDGGEERIISNIDSEGKHCHVARVPSLLPSVLNRPLLQSSFSSKME